MKLRRWERRKAKIRPADMETYQIQADSPEGH